jgi:cyclophilin family peptidyl-prolyl cis-trans isomerase
MAQGGDFSRGDGTGGESIYGGEFKDENFIRKHLGPGMLSMANAGPHTNGSQFFITFRNTPHLNGKHVVFGRLINGLPFLRDIELLRTGANNRPHQDVTIVNCGMVADEVEEKKEEKVAVVVAPGGANDEEIDISDSDSDENNEDEKQAEPEEKVEVAAPTFANPRAQKLFELRLALNKSRKANHREVISERKRINEGGSSKETRSNYLAKQEAWKKELKDSGENPDHGWLRESAESANAKIKKKRMKKKNQAAFGWDVFNQDAQYNAYNKRLTNMTQNVDTNFRDVDSLDYVVDVKPSDAAIESMVAELEEGQKRREKFSRRRPVYEGADVDAINDRNYVFNKKAKRAFDKYTTEVRANLERGTALN